MSFPCPACGKQTRTCQDERQRICSVCRKVSRAVDCTEANAPKLVPRKKPGVDDDVGLGDSTFGWLDTAAPPQFPCKDCGRETKAHHEPGTRYCKGCELVQ